MQIINVGEKKESQILIGESFKNYEKYISSYQKVIIITDENVFNFYQDFFFNYPVIKIKPGETNKTWNTVTYLIDQLIDFEADRETFILGFGGGIVCDITGFVASIYMRGIKFGFVSTTLLSQVDASLGGKNGINVNSYKNLVGNFNQPEFVICDSLTFATLNSREIKSGFGEIIKHAIISDHAMFNSLKINYTKALNLNKEIIEDLISNSINIKSTIVNKDCFEKGERKLLNFGHTIGHAIETSGEYTHGEAIAIGMVYASIISNKLGYITSEELNQVINLLKLYQLPTSTHLSNEYIVNALLKDKKRDNQSIDFILIKSIGKAFIQKINIEKIKQLVP